MIRRLLGKIIKLIVFVCIILYTAFFLNALFDLRVNCPVINDFLAAIANCPLPGIGTLGGLVILVIGGLTLLGAFND